MEQDYCLAWEKAVKENPAKLDEVTQKFMSELEIKVSRHDQEIEQMCSAHYKSFIDCIQELLQIRPNAERLKNETTDINAELMKSTEAIHRKGEELIRARRILVNSSSSIESIKKCLYVLEQYTKFRDQLQEKKYFPALKTLESLERDHLPTVSNYRFAENMRKEIPKYRVVIKEASTKDLNDFLEGLLVKSQSIGESVLRSAAKQQNFDDYNQWFGKDLSDDSVSTSSSSSRKNSVDLISGSTPKPASSKKRRAPQPPGSPATTITNGMNRRDSLKHQCSDVPSALSSIDFSPVYRGLHIFTNLGFRQWFDDYYREQRQKQSRLAFSPPQSMQSISAYHDYFCSVIGFFVIEDHLMGTTKDFIKPDYLVELWKNAIQSMTNSMRQNAKMCRDASLMLKIKKLMMLFTFTIRNYGHNTDPLSEILITLREQYNDILMNQCQKRFEDIFRQDNYIPLEVRNNEEYLQVVRSMSFETRNRDFPQTLPFSQFVPKICDEVRNFIEQSLKFSQDLNSSQTDVENMVRKSTNQLLTKTLGSCLTVLINGSSLKLSQLIQITINTNHLENEMLCLDAHITYQIIKSMSGLSSCYLSPIRERASESVMLQTDRAMSSDGQANHVGQLVDGNSNVTQVKLVGQSMFKDARAEAETQIYRKLNDDIDKFMSLADYDWTMVAPTGTSRQASSFITEMIDYLKITFQTFTNLPQHLSQGACMSACKHIAQSLRELLLSDDIKALSLGALDQFNLDLMHCEMFANGEPVPGFSEGDLQMAFAELRQLCDLFLCEDYSTYMSDMGKQQSRYLRVTTATALSVVDKLREFDRKKSVFALTKKNDKHRLRDMFAKNLRQAQQQPQ